jgi:hypothetical protein
MGYANRFVRLEFPELGDDVYVEIRNPQLAPPAMLRGDVSPTPEGYSPDTWHTFVVVAKLVKSWQVFDAESDEDEQPVLELPATPETVAKVPATILRKITGLIEEAINPR